LLNGGTKGNERTEDAMYYKGAISELELHGLAYTRQYVLV